MPGGLPVGTQRMSRAGKEEQGEILKGDQSLVENGGSPQQSQAPAAENCRECLTAVITL